MGSLAPEFGLDLMMFAKKSIGGFLKDEMASSDGTSAKLEDIVRRLEEERGKIEAFKRELPLCMFLLADVIGALKLELDRCQSDGCVLEEFIPLKAGSDEEEEQREVKLEKESNDKMEWMSSAQLWSDNCSDESFDCKKDSQEMRNGESDGRRDVETLSFESRSRCSGGENAGGGTLLVPFNVMPVPKKEEEKLSISLPDLSLVPPAIEASPSAPTAYATAEDDNRISCSGSKTVTRAPVASSSTGGTHLSLQSQQQYQQQPPRKARRCWSPELHRRFIISLQQLGGAQVATPKQIRELMKVDGLTNDEVKSHLQKYRLHTRRLPINSSASPVNKPVGMAEGLWVSQDLCSTSQQSASQSGSPQGPLQLACTGQALSVTGGDSCDDDGKSESYSWK